MTTIKKQEGKATPVRRVVKADTKLVMTEFNQEDEFLGLYLTRGGAGVVIEPPFNQITLAKLATRNNTLAQCIEAMRVNVDGTGYEIRLKDEMKENKEEQERLKVFFQETFPNISFVTTRKLLREDIETTGNAYLEVIRNVEGSIVFLRHLSAISMRLVKLDDPVWVTKKVTRMGKEFDVQVSVRERRFAQSIGSKLTYFKDYGCTRRINRDTGNWLKDEEKAVVEKLGSEIIHFTANKDVVTAYGIPRWINQLPSILGSRKAEEYNLGFFDAGGLPPAIIFLQGGMVTDAVRRQLENYLSGKSADKYRGLIVEAQATSGSLDKEGKVEVKVERFGNDNMKDSMFQSYDVACEEHVRASFRLPALFVGRNKDTTYASAYTSYLIAEAQVFAPERDEFDEIINNTICKELGAENYEFRSLPLTISDLESKLKAIGLVKELLDAKELVTTVGDLTHIQLTPSAGALDGTIKPTGVGGNGLGSEKPSESAVKEDTSEVEQVVSLVNDWRIVEGFSEGYTRLTKAEVYQQVSALSNEALTAFNSLVATKIDEDIARKGLEAKNACSE